MAGTLTTKEASTLRLPCSQFCQDGWRAGWSLGREMPFFSAGACESHRESQGRASGEVTRWSGGLPTPRPPLQPTWTDGIIVFDTTLCFVVRLTRPIVVPELERFPKDAVRQRWTWINRIILGLKAIPETSSTSQILSPKVFPSPRAQCRDSLCGEESPPAHSHLEEYKSLLKNIQEIST